ncbi:gp181 [Bacillus phage W.Ph.]|uniref:Gp181 n=1 Tax=Bacillus phage W.Ph. TaxID=764595 RepID=G9B1T2_9CAUD|nr:gp181 [Bacillus phage W.Ph.]ADH03327.1 gp181 [Bacillus phage W.Ph.]
MITKLRVNNITRVIEAIQEAKGLVKLGELTKIKSTQMIADTYNVKMSLVSELWEEIYKGDE